ncbi:hypothetical protein AUG19_04580 [archaeon 13_1_20CM_2_54_9]|nr:MAG: hypothetical protein AUJ07_09250 [Crenarchaeota archaeon 13_1_40CM_3_53_5]OLE75807.1 MAG: hypothetical protein AUG19_04580 [archaeon 13_1_20CM_2_54_9]
MPGPLWIRARLGVEDRLVRVTSAEGTVEFRATRLAWKRSDSLSLSGLNERSHLTRVILRFKGEDAAKVAAGILSSQIEERQSLEAKWGELPVELLAMVQVGPLFLVLLVWPIALFLALVLRAPSDFRSALSYGGLVAFVLAMIRLSLMDAELKAGPARAWFRPRRVKAWISVDADYLTVRTLGNVEGFVPSRIEWNGTDSFAVVSGRTRFRILFGKSDEATELLSKIRASFPNVEVATV